MQFEQFNWTRNKFQMYGEYISIGICFEIGSLKFIFNEKFYQTISFLGLLVQFTRITIHANLSHGTVRFHVGILYYCVMTIVVVVILAIWNTLRTEMKRYSLVDNSIYVFNSLSLLKLAVQSEMSIWKIPIQNKRKPETLCHASIVICFIRDLLINSTIICIRTQMKSKQKHLNTYILLTTYYTLHTALEILAKTVYEYFAHKPYMIHDTLIKMKTQNCPKIHTGNWILSL